MIRCHMILSFGIHEPDTIQPILYRVITDPPNLTDPVLLHSRIRPQLRQTKN